MRAQQCEGDADKRTFPVAPEKLHGVHTAPDTPWQALMECRPGDEPSISKQELLPLRDVIADALDALPARERWVVERHAIERLSFSVIGTQLSLSKSMAHKIYQKAQRRLQAELWDHPLVRGHINNETEFP